MKIWPRILEGKNVLVGARLGMLNAICSFCGVVGALRSSKRFAIEAESIDAVGQPAYFL